MAFTQKNVFRLDIPMDDAVSMRVIKRVRRLAGDANCVVDWKLTLARQSIAEAFALDERHREPQMVVCLAVIVNARCVDAGVGAEADFLFEPICAQTGGDIWMENLERNGALVAHIVCEENRREPAASQLALEAILPSELIGERGEVSQCLCL